MSMQEQSDQTARGQRSCSQSSCSKSAFNGSSQSRFSSALAQWEASSNGQFCAVLAFAGFCGALLRFFMQSLPLPWVDGFPVSTIVVNTLGSFLIVVVFCAGQRAHLLSPALVKVINRGFLGAFTTLSAVCVDADELLASGNDLGAFLYVALTFVLSFGAALAAMRIFGAYHAPLGQKFSGGCGVVLVREASGEQNVLIKQTASSGQVFSVDDLPSKIPGEHDVCSKAVGDCMTLAESGERR